MFRNKTAIITGAGSGIARSSAILFAQAGANVTAVDIDQESANSCVDEIRSLGRNGLAITGDASQEPCIREAVDCTVATFGRVDYVVCCAGAMWIRSADLASPEDWAKCLSTNVTAAALAARYSSRQMRLQGGGAIVFVSSICGHRPDPGFTTYATSKAALLMLTRSLALDYGSCNIRVNAVSPGPVDTPGLRSIVEGANGQWDNWKASVVAMQCLPYMIQPQDIGRAILFLCSEDARMITGTSLVIDGGLLARSTAA